MAFKFWSILASLIVGLLGIGHLHDYLITGEVREGYEDAPRILRKIIESHDMTNARRLVQAAAYAEAAGQYAVIPGNLKRTVERLTGRIERDQFDDSPVHVTVAGLTDAEVVRVQRFLEFKEGVLSLKAPSSAATKPRYAGSPIGSTARPPRITVSRPLGTNAGIGI